MGRRRAARLAGVDANEQAAVEGAFDGGTIDQASGRVRMRALRLPDPPFEPPFEHFQPF